MFRLRATRTFAYCDIPVSDCDFYLPRTSPLRGDRVPVSTTIEALRLADHQVRYQAAFRLPYQTPDLPSAALITVHRQ